MPVNSFRSVWQTLIEVWGLCRGNKDDWHTVFTLQSLAGGPGGVNERSRTTLDNPTEHLDVCVSKQPADQSWSSAGHKQLLSQESNWESLNKGSHKPSFLGKRTLAKPACAQWEVWHCTNSYPLHQQKTATWFHFIKFGIPSETIIMSPTSTASHVP